tara:strand:- start:7 stop:153 length:147 start_codon:yes stop_codon:yes gene_type:complete
MKNVKLRRNYRATSKILFYFLPIQVFLETVAGGILEEGILDIQVSNLP